MQTRATSQGRWSQLRFVVPLLCVAMASAADYHFSASGNDTTGNGSQAQPWQTIAKANQLDLEPGDRILFKGGDTFLAMDETDFLDDVERVTNGGFEDGMTDWSTWSPSDVALIASAHGGTQALQITGAQDSWPGIYRYLDTGGIQGGDALVLRSWARVTDAGGLNAKQWISADLKILLQGETVAVQSCVMSPSWEDINAGWTEFVCAIQVPTQFDAIELSVYQQGGMTLILDDFSVRRVRSYGGTLQLDSDDDGSSVAGVGITSYGTGRATIEGRYLSGIRASTDYLEISELNLVGIMSENTRQPGLWLEGRTGTSLHDLHLHDLTVSGFGGHGFVIDDCPEETGDGYDGILIENCLSQANRGDGFLTDGKTVGIHRNVVVRNCQAIDNTGWDGSNRGSGIRIGSADGVLVEHCYAENNGFDSNPFGGGTCGIWLVLCNNGIIQWCEAAATGSQSIDGGGLDIDGGCTNCIIQYCYSHDNKGPGFFHAKYGGAPATTDNVFRYCVSINDRKVNYNSSGVQGVLNYWGGVTRCHTHNCVIIGNRDGGALVRRESGGTDSLVFNNIFITGSSDRTIFSSRDDGPITYFNNIWYSLDGTGPKFALYDSFNTLTTHFGVATWENLMAGRAYDNLELDPALAQTLSDPAQTPWLYGDTSQIANLVAFQLTGASAAIDGGLDPATLINAVANAVPVSNPSQDLFGNAVPVGGAWDIGVHEWGEADLAAHVQLTNPQRALVRWQEPANTAYYLLRRKHSSVSNQLMLALPQAPSSAFVDQTLGALDPVDYRYDLQAIDSSDTVSIEALDLAPLDLGLSQADSNGDILVDWNDAANAEWYLLDRKTDGVDNQVMIRFLPVNPSEYLDQAVDAMQSYVYNIYAGLASVFGDS